MAETSFIIEQDSSLLKHVQELAIDGVDPPAKYIQKNRDDGSNNIDANSLSSSSIPVINLSLLSSSTSSAKEREDEMEKLRLALTSWGFFQAIGHGIPSSLLDELHEIAKEFFDLPIEEKHRYSVEKDGTQGYGNDPAISDDQILDWTDRLYLMVKPEDQRKLKLWPHNPSHFRDVLNEYSTKNGLMAEFILNVMAESLGLEEDYFLNQIGEHAPAFARFNYYPPCARPDLVYGLKPHKDVGVITILFQDKEVEGLQVLKDGQWIKVPIIPHALLVNVADQIEIMSNGAYKSPMHRVITNSKKERFSIAMLHLSEVEKEIEPAARLISESRPRLFRKIKIKDYEEVFFQKISMGIRAIDWARV